MPSTSRWSALLLNSLPDPLVGVGLVAGRTDLGALDQGSGAQTPLREAASAAPPRNRAADRRVLVVANRTLHGSELRAEIHDRAAAGAELHIVAPILCSRMHYIASDAGAAPAR